MPEDNYQGGLSSPNPGAETTTGSADGGHLRPALRERSESTSITHRTEREPTVQLDLVRLINHESNTQHCVAEGSVETNTIGNERANGGEHAQKHSFVGESWYAGYLISRSAGSHSELHRSWNDGNGLRGLYRSSSIQPDQRSHDLPSQDIIQRLLEAYFSKFHILCPIIDRASFLRAVIEGEIAIALLRAVLFVGSIHCDPEVFHLAGYTKRTDFSDEMFYKACLEFDTGSEGDRTTMILTSYLLHYWFGKPTKYRDSLWYLANAIRSAQCMGYHRSTSNSKMAIQDKSYVRIIWWCLYIRDRQVSLSTGAPMVINDLDHDVEPLAISDFDDDEKHIAEYMISQASLNKVTSGLYFEHCAPMRLDTMQESMDFARATEQIKSTVDEWYANNRWLNVRPSRDRHSLCVQVCMQFYKINLLQRVQQHAPGGTRPTPSGSSSTIQQAANTISSLVEDCLLYWQPDCFPLIFVTAIFSAMTAYVTEFGHRREQLLQRLRPNLLILKQFEQCHVTARWIRMLFMDLLDRHMDSEPKATTSVPAPQQENLQCDTSQENSVRVGTAQMPPYAVTRSTNRLQDLDGTADQHTFSTRVDGEPNSSGHAEASSGLDGLHNSQNVAESPKLLDPAFVDEFFSFPHDMHSENGSNTFPSPSTMAYQSMYYLADLGLNNGAI